MGKEWEEEEDNHNLTGNRQPTYPKLPTFNPGYTIQNPPLLVKI